jgi:purine nucleoside permease
MKKDYVATGDFWHGARFVQAGETIALTDGQAKYLAHTIEEKKVEVPKAPKKAAAKD